MLAPMRFGLFYQAPEAPGQSHAQRYTEMFELIAVGEELGFDVAWLAELHFGGAFSLLSNPLMAVPAIAARTRRIRIGTAVTLLPLHHPLSCAEQAATALRPVAGDAAALLFTIGLVGTGMLGVPVLAGSAAYAIAEAAAWRSGMDEKIHNARQFYAVIAVAMLGGTLVVASPKGYELPERVRAEVASIARLRGASAASGPTWTVPQKPTLT